MLAEVSLRKLKNEIFQIEQLYFKEESQHSSIKGRNNYSLR